MGAEVLRLALDRHLKLSVYFVNHTYAGVFCRGKGKLSILCPVSPATLPHPADRQLLIPPVNQIIAALKFFHTMLELGSNGRNLAIMGVPAATGSHRRDGQAQ